MCDEKTKVLTIQQLAEHLMITKATLVKNLKNKTIDIPSYRLGRFWRFNLSDVIKWQQEQPAKYEAEKEKKEIAKSKKKKCRGLT